MKFETMHALKGLDDRTPGFFKTEALATEPDEFDEFEAKETAARVLSTNGDAKVVALLKEILRLV